MVLYLQLSAYLQNREDNINRQFVAKLFTYLYLTINAKLPIRKRITRILHNAKSNIITCYLTEHLQLFMTKAKNESHLKLQKQNEYLSILLSCVENFQPGLDAVSSIVKEVFSFAVDVFYELINTIK